MVMPLNQVYVKMINAFRDDCNNLITKFKEKSSEDFRDFVPIWKAMKFNFIYEKYTKQGLIHDFKEDTLQIAKHIMLYDDFVCGMFLMYSLYYLQEEPKSTIRLERLEFDKLLKLMGEERKTLIETCQPGYMFAKLLKSEAFSFVRFSREFSMEGLNRARLVHGGQHSTLQEENKIDPKAWLEGFLQKCDFIDDLRTVEQEYAKRKAKLKEEHPDLNLALDMVPDDIITGIENTLTDDVPIQDQQPVSIGTKRRKLKNRRMKIKHRYKKRVSDTEDERQTVSVECKKKGPPKGHRKLYFRRAINEPESESDGSYKSDPDDPKLTLPTIE